MSSNAAVHRMAHEGLDAGFWAGLAAGELRILACGCCEQWIWPAQPRCPDCGPGDLEWRSVEPRGTVYSWTRTHYPFVEVRSDSLPYVVLLVELPHAGSVRLLGQYGGDANDHIDIGAAVRGAIIPPSARSFGLPSLRWDVDTDTPVAGS